MVTYREEFSPIKSNDPLNTCCYVGACDKLKTLYLHYQILMAFELGRVVIYREELPPTKSHGSNYTVFITRDYVTNYYIISPLPFNQ